MTRPGGITARARSAQVPRVYARGTARNPRVRAPRRSPRTAHPMRPAGERILADLRSDIARADAKAAVLVGALGVGSGALGGLLAGGAWSPGAFSPAGAALWWTGTAASTLSLVALLMAVVPRYGRPHWAPGSPLTYFGDIRQAVDAGRLADALAETERHPYSALTVALAENSRIAARKHLWIRVGLIAFGAGAWLMSGALLIG